MLGKDECLNEETQVLVEKFDDFGYNMLDEIIWFSEQGKVSDPELFEQILKGKSIDTSDYYIALGSERPYYHQEGYN